jgi:hypothetical protein
MKVGRVLEYSHNICPATIISGLVDTVFESFSIWWDLRTDCRKLLCWSPPATQSPDFFQQYSSYYTISGAAISSTSAGCWPIILSYSSFPFDPQTSVQKVNFIVAFIEKVQQKKCHASQQVPDRPAAAELGRQPSDPGPRREDR